MPNAFANVILDSVSPQGVRLTTIHMRYWRGIHAEIMTHRAFSRNARSSRAVPIQKMIDEVVNDPFIPRHWGANQKGMQAGDECNEMVDIFGTGVLTREEAWLWARDRAVSTATGFMNAGYHKQLVNRLLEPFLMIDTLVSSTDWANFFALRTDSAAEPHFQDMARMTELAMKISKPNKLMNYQWHRPYVEMNDVYAVQKYIGSGIAGGDPTVVDMLNKISAARCARISYRPFDGNDTIEAELKRYDQLVNNGLVHASPLEHQARPDQRYTCRVIQTDANPVIERDNGDRSSTILNEYSGPETKWLNPELHGNFYGWCQARKLVPNESVKDIRP